MSEAVRIDYVLREKRFVCGLIVSYGQAFLGFVDSTFSAIFVIRCSGILEYTQAEQRQTS
jgi:hypothetical protein